MNPEVKALWLTALRSGKYRQTNGVLNDGVGGFCCLGVLCSIAVESGVEIEVDEDDKVGNVQYDHCGEYLPRSVQQWAGLVDRDNPQYGDSEDQNLAYQNDEGASFASIASLIEEFL